MTGCGTPDVEALLYPIIDSGGQIIHVRVLNRGRGYDPLRLQIIPEQETPNVVDSFDFNRIWQGHPNSPTTGTFATSGTVKTDRLTIVSDNHPKPLKYFQLNINQEDQQQFLIELSIKHLFFVVVKMFQIQELENFNQTKQLVY